MQPFYQSVDFTCYQHQRGSGDDYNPFGQVQRYGAEYFSSEFDNEYTALRDHVQSAAEDLLINYNEYLTYQYDNRYTEHTQCMA